MKNIYKWYQLKRNMRMIPIEMKISILLICQKKKLMRRSTTIYHEGYKNMFYKHDHLNKCYVLWKEIILNIFKNSTMIIKSLVLKEAKTKN